MIPEPLQQYKPLTKGYIADSWTLFNGRPTYLVFHDDIMRFIADRFRAQEVIEAAKRTLISPKYTKHPEDLEAYEKLEEALKAFEVKDDS